MQEQNLWGFGGVVVVGGGGGLFSIPDKKKEPRIAQHTFTYTVRIWHWLPRDVSPLITEQRGKYMGKTHHTCASELNTLSRRSV